MVSSKGIATLALSSLFGLLGSFLVGTSLLMDKSPQNITNIDTINVNNAPSIIERIVEPVSSGVPIAAPQEVVFSKRRSVNLLDYLPQSNNLRQSRVAPLEGNDLLGIESHILANYQLGERSNGQFSGFFTRTSSGPKQYAVGLDIEVLQFASQSQLLTYTASNPLYKEAHTLGKSYVIPKGGSGDILLIITPKPEINKNSRLTGPFFNPLKSLMNQYKLSL